MHGASGRHRPFADHLREVPALQVFHRDEEIRSVRAVLVDDRHVSALAAEFLLQRGSPALGFEHLLAVPIGFDRDQLERDPLVRQRVGRQEHDGHAPAPDLLVDLVPPDTMEDGCHHRFAPPRGVGRGAPAARASTNQLARANAARAWLGPVKMFAAAADEHVGVELARRPAASTITVL